MLFRDYRKNNVTGLYALKQDQCQAVTVVLHLLATVILSSLLALTEAVPPLPFPYPCNPGYALEPNGSCTICPPGTATDNPLWGCDQCPPGTVSPYEGVTSVSLCQPCPSNFAAVNGGTECKQCEPGQVAIGQGRCLNCPKGKRITQLGRCERCDYFSISTSANSRECTPCSDGLFPERLHVKCIRRNCPIGATWTVVQKDGKFIAGCHTCPPNSFRLKTMPSCEPCKPYEVAYPPHKPRRCLRCSPGTFVAGLQEPMVMSSPEPWYTPEPSSHSGDGGPSFVYTEETRSCVPCPANTTTLGHSKATCRVVGEDCPFGTFEDIDGDCQRCVRNMRRSLSQGSCVACSDGYVSPGGTSSECRSCPPNSVVLNGRCDCTAGHVFQSGQCVPCPAGTYRTPEENPYFSDNACLFCPPLTFSNAGAASCTPCPDGWTSVGTNGRKCVQIPKCEPGYVIPNDDLEMWGQVPACVSAVSGCPKGLVNAGIWGTTACYDENVNKFVCAADWLPTLSLFGATCLKCEFGIAVFDSGSGTWDCFECEWDEVRIGGIYGSCKKCKDGFVPDLSGSPICVCPDGWYIDSGQCLPCPFSMPFELLPTACLFHRLP